MKPEFIIGVDLGKLRDFSAVAVVERFSVRTGFDAVRFCDSFALRNVVRGLARVRLGTCYPRVVEKVREVVERLSPIGRCTVVVDGNGVGVPVVDLLRAARMDCLLVPVTTTGGDHASRGSGGWNVPKRELIVGLQTMIAGREIEIAADLPLRGALVDELTQIGRNLRAVGTGHDDLAMAVALACWRVRARGSIGERGERLL